MVVSKKYDIRFLGIFRLSVIAEDRSNGEYKHHIGVFAAGFRLVNVCFRTGTDFCGRKNADQGTMSRYNPIVVALYWLRDLLWFGVVCRFGLNGGLLSPIGRRVKKSLYYRPQSLDASCMCGKLKKCVMGMKSYEWHDSGMTYGMDADDQIISDVRHSECVRIEK